MWRVSDLKIMLCRGVGGSGGEYRCETTELIEAIDEHKATNEILL
jgi:hypothetical protein